MRPEQDTQPRNIFEERHSRFVLGPGLGDKAAHHDRVAVADGESGIGIAAIDDGNWVLVDDDISAPRAELLRDFHDDESVWGNEGRDKKAEADVGLLNHRTRRQTARPDVTTVVREPGDVWDCFSDKEAAGDGMGGLN